MNIAARYQNGVFVPLQPVTLEEGTVVSVSSDGPLAVGEPPTAYAAGKRREVPAPGELEAFLRARYPGSAPWGAAKPPAKARPAEDGRTLEEMDSALRARYPGSFGSMTPEQVAECLGEEGAPAGNG